MELIRHVEIENFKTFGEKIHLDIAHPSVLIGPNNAGKTSVIQALALWSRGIGAWYEKKGNPKTKEKRERISAGINRLSIFELPVTDTRFLWKDTRVTHKNNPVKFAITVGVLYENEVVDCRLEFTRRDNDTIYCRPSAAIINNDELLAYLITISFNLLYPMSGIETEETLLPEGRINVLMGQGQTAQVLRNLCYIIHESDQESGDGDWGEITRLINKMFLVELREPEFNETRGNISLRYRQDSVENDLDISLAGRGLQQFLLILAYLFSHKRSVLLIDEPDAHLEILRQRQVYEILREKAKENLCQVIIATHSEVILEEAVDVNLTLLINGSSVDMASSSDIQSALKTFGVDHYVKARIRPNILYVEGTTDVKILQELARHLNHDAYQVLSEPINVFYTQNVNAELSLDSTLDIAAGAFSNYRQHFYALKRFVPGLKAIAIFDHDNRDVQAEISSDFAVVYWEDYEIENYFITPASIMRYVTGRYQPEADLFTTAFVDSMKRILDRAMLDEFFSGDERLLAEYKSASDALQRTLVRGYKMSAFAERVFHEFAVENGMPVPLRKSDYHEIVKYVPPDGLNADIREKLDLLVEYLNPS